MLAYVIIKFKEMILQENDGNSTTYGSLDLEGLGDVSYDELQLVPFWVIRK